jgi:hypothetical protein
LASLITKSHPDAICDIFTVSEADAASVSIVGALDERTERDCTELMIFLESAPCGNQIQNSNAKAQPKTYYQMSFPGEPHL